jgi:hypothetical protein
LFILYRKGIILNVKSAQVLEGANSDDGSPEGSNKVCADLSPGMVKVIEMKEADGIIEETNMDFGKQHIKETQNIDLGSNQVRKTSSKRVSSMKQSNY